MNGPRVSFLVVNHNGRDVLGACLASIRGQRGVSFELLLVDNGSSDGSLQQVTPRNNERILRLGENLGFAEGNNRAFAEARGEFVALVNNDATLAPDWAWHLVEALLTHPEAGAAAGRTLQHDDPERLDSAGFEFFSCVSCTSYQGLAAEHFRHRAHRPFGAAASAALYRRSAIEASGLFHPEFFCFYEDTDLALRLLLHGFDTVYVDAAVAWHRGSHTAKRHSPFHTYHLRRNSEFVYWINMQGRLALLHLPYHLVHEWLSTASAATRGQLPEALRAKRDALRALPWIVHQRHELRRKLERAGPLSAAQARLSAKMTRGFPYRTHARQAARSAWARLFGRNAD
ncbi:MAG: glycosyltransferase family 2 protein [Myxococcales bacterium]|nr:glycosyltransferase family 2 protein [Myxococcales bacterium]